LDHLPVRVSSASNLFVRPVFPRAVPRAIPEERRAPTLSGFGWRASSLAASLASSFYRAVSAKGARCERRTTSGPRKGRPFTSPSFPPAVTQSVGRSTRPSPATFTELRALPSTLRSMYTSGGQGASVGVRSATLDWICALKPAARAFWREKGLGGLASRQECRSGDITARRLIRVLIDDATNQAAIIGAVM